MSRVYKVKNFRTIQCDTWHVILNRTLLYHDLSE
mgnify:CR=1 FL=1